MVSIVLWWSLGASVFSSPLPVAHPGIPGEVQTHPVSSRCVGYHETNVHFFSFMPFFLFYDTGFPEPPWSGNHRFWHQSSGATVFYSGWGRSCEGHFYPGSACMEPLPHEEKCACLSRCVENLWDSENASSLFCCRDEEIRSKCGIDAVTYLSFQRHIILLMTVVTLLSLAVILPVNISGNLLGILVLKWWSS